MTLYLDLDGVLADFDARVRALFGRAPEELRLDEMWRRAEGTPGFFEHMPKTPDADELWAFCQPFDPQILTGLPRGDWAAEQKRRWVARHLGADVPVITCLAREKCVYAAPGDVLVDDRTRYAHLWEAQGGIFVPHTSAAASIAALRELGFAPSGGGVPGSRSGSRP
ncbi:MAG: hypothetical protein AB7F65_12200 [Dehalococcoidia bacterium]